MKPVIFVDVDGVLSPDGPYTPGYQQHKAGGYKLYLNSAHGEQLQELARETGAELVWCTMWEGMANWHISSRVGLPDDMPVVPMNHMWPPETSIGLYKTMAAVEYAGDRPFVWFDDEPDAAEWVEKLKQGPAQVIQVNPAVGLQPQDLAAAHHWLSHLALDSHAPNA